jgi:predicted Zn-ribbon and HTH transcriptional regulator
LFKAEFKCPKCDDLVLDTYNLLDEHFNKIHVDCKLNKIHMCKDCGSVFRTKYKLNIHSKTRTTTTTKSVNKKRLAVENEEEEECEDEEEEEEEGENEGLTKRVKLSPSDCPKCKKQFKNHDLWTKDNNTNFDS